MCSRPRTQVQVSSKKKVFKNFFQALHKILTIQEIELSSSREQANFRGLEASRPRPKSSKCVLEDSSDLMPFTLHEVLHVAVLYELFSKRFEFL